MTWSTDVLVAATAVVAGFMKITFGVGAGAMITPFLVLAAGPQFALAVLALILPCGDLLAIRTYWGNWDRAQAFALIPATLLGVALALLYLSRAHSSSLGKTIGVITLLLVAFRLWLRSRHGSLGVILFPLWGRAALGIVGGIVSILAGGGGAFYSLYLASAGLSKRAFVATIVLIFLVMDGIRLIVYWNLHFLRPAYLGGLILIVPAMLAGGWIGRRVNMQMSEAQFATWITVIICLSGLVLIVR